MEIEGGKATNRGEDFFFQNNWNLLFWVYQMEVSTGKKTRKNDFAPSEKYACYAPAPMANKINDVLLSAANPSQK